MTFAMLWDPGFDSWSFYDVVSQPAYALVDAEGTLVEKGFGMFPDDIADRLV